MVSTSHTPILQQFVPTYVIISCLKFKIHNPALAGKLGKDEIRATEATTPRD